MSSHTGRPEREPLGSLAGLARTSWSPWPLPEVLESTPSTMADVERRAAEGAPEGTAVVAEEQTAGRGRRGRSWDSPARAGLWWSVLLRPPLPPERLGWLPLVVGIGVARGLRQAAGVEVRLKWPNDVLLDGRKLAGILAERLGDGGVIVGVGINVDQGASELPDGGISLAGAGAVAPAGLSRTRVLMDVLAAVADAYRQWLQGEDMRQEYVGLSATIGEEVAADLGGSVLAGRATGLGVSGELLIVDDAGTEHQVSAGDVTLRRMPR